MGRRVSLCWALISHGAHLQADSKIGKLLTLGREWLFQLVPHVLSKVNRVQCFGQMESHIVRNRDRMEIEMHCPFVSGMAC